MIRTIQVVLLFVLSAGAVAAEPPQGLAEFLHLSTGVPAGPCLPPGERVPVESLSTRDALAPADTAALLPFHPQGGQLHRDLPLVNYVDLDPSPGLLDFKCTNWLYDGHAGHDVSIRSFAEQDGGVPVFAALDGEVEVAHDGEPDRNTSSSGQPANYVVLRHVGSHRTYYYHLRKNSVAVSVGNQVVAGQQIGLTGSSGSSTYPHLHFESRVNGVVFEPYAGACRAGASGWVSQPPAQTTPVVIDWVYSSSSFGGFPMPEDGAPRTGTFTMASPVLIYLRFQVTGLPAGANGRFRFLRPNGSTASDNALPFNNGSPGRFDTYALGYFVNLDTAGTWRTLFDVNGQTVADAPFTVVAPGGVPANRPPNPVTASLVIPAGGAVPFCRVTASLVTPDPDYDRVRFRYLWKVDGSTVRDNTFASHSDALARTAATPPGGLMTCEVTPTDGSLNASTVTASLRVPDPAAGDANTDGTRDIFDVVLLSSLIVGNSVAGQPPFTGTYAKMNLNPSTGSTVDVFDLVILSGFVVGNVPSLPQ